MAPTATTDPTETIVIEPCTYAILPTGDGFDFDADADWYLDYDDALEAAMDWSVEISVPVRIYVKRDEQWVPIREVEA